MQPLLTNTDFLQNRSNPSLTSVGFGLLAFLVLSFAYELPLVEFTGKDRLNPRLFDFATVFIALYWLFAGRNRGWRLSMANPILRVWSWIMVFFIIATVCSVLWIPIEIYTYSLYYCVRYLIGTLVLFIIAAVPWEERSKRRILWVTVAGSVWVNLIAILQFVGIVSKTRVLPSGVEIITSEHGIFSTLGVTYWHLGMFSLLSFMITIALARSERQLLIKLFLISLACFSSIGAFVSGSRASLFAICIAVFLLVLRKGFKHVIAGILACLLVLSLGYFLYLYSGTKQRLEKKTSNTSESRILTGPIMLERAFSYHGIKLLLVGGGFYVVPLPKESAGVTWSEPKYRKGYGNHNIFLFPLEQAGIFAFALAILMWVRIIRRLWLFRRIRISSKDYKESISGHLANSILIYTVALLIVGVAGQVFWLGFGTENFTIYQMMMFLIATSPVTTYGEVRN